MSGIEVTPFIDSSHGQGKLIIVEMIEDKDDIVAYLQNLLHRERFIHPPCTDYISKIRSIAIASDVDPVNEKWRRKLCEWCYEVTDHFKCKYRNECFGISRIILHHSNNLCIAFF
jgi:hypothetical protein